MNSARRYRGQASFCVQAKSAGALCVVIELRQGEGAIERKAGVPLYSASSFPQKQEPGDRARCRLVNMHSMKSAQLEV
jgi:hypothetical protein